MWVKTGVLAALLLTLGAGTALGQGRTVSGTVRDSLTGGPINGASVSIRGTTQAALTDANGRFALAAAPAGDVVLQVRALGYFRRDVPVGATTGTVDIVLPRDVFKLEEIVVSGQATGIERRNLPNAVATVNAEELANHPTASIEQQLQGKVAGADIQSNSGAPGGGVQVRLRGITSINADASPLYVVDGVIMSDVAIPSNANVLTGAAGGSNPSLTQDAQVNRIADLNPGEIESIEILKGASAAALYGGRASNGVVIITTKRGRQGARRIELTQRFGTSFLLRKVGTRRFADAADANSWRGGAGDTYCTSGGCPFFDHEEILANENRLAWQTSASVSGGTENTQYFASGSVENTPGIVLNTGFSRQSVRLNLDQRFSDRVTLSLNTNLIHTEAERGLTNNDNLGVSYFNVLTGTPSLVDLRQQADGTFPRNPYGNSNPVQTASLIGNEEDVWRMLGSTRLQWTAISSQNSTLRFDATGGLDFFLQKNGIFSPPELQYEPLDGFLGTSLLSNTDNLNLNLNGNLVHTYTGGGFTARTSVGAQFARRELDISRTEALDLVAGQSNVDAGTSVRVRQDRSLIKNLGFFAQEELLLLDERLNLTAGIRADQSSLNADASQLHYYPKLAASYRFEGDPGGLLNEVKFRGAFGQTGNEPLYGQRFTPLNSQLNIGGIAGTVVLGTSGSAELKPEREQEVEVGVDAQLLRNRASLEASWYQKNVSDLLLTRNLPPSSGFTQEIFNGGKLRTRGLEVAAAIVPIQTAETYWFFRTTFALNRSTITELPVPPFQTGGFGAVLGIFQVEEGKSATQIVGTDTLPDGKTNPENVVLGDANPDFKMSFTSSLNWKRFNLYALVDWQQGGNVINLTRLLTDLNGTSPDVEEAGRRASVFLRRAAPWVESATFAKVREVAVSYDLPTTVAQALWGGIRSARLSLSVRNLFWFATPYTGYDPEVSNFGNQPIARNIEVTPYPAARTFFFTINLGL